MIDTEITILINRKSDLDLIKQKVIDRKIHFPVYIFEYENHYQLNFTSDYEEWELDSAILESFPEYELTSDLERGRKEIRLQLSRYQSDFSTDGWGRPIENPLDETKYLIKKSNSSPEKFNPHIKVLFEDREQDYFIHIIDGINRASGEKGFLLLNEFRVENTIDVDFFKDKLYATPLDAFHSGYYKMQDSVNSDFKKYLDQKKSELREKHKIPRKIVRDFIKSCNNCESDGILKNLAENMTYEKMVNWRTELKVEGINDFKEYINSPDQELCNRNFTIRSSWDINLPIITIGVKYFSVTSTNELRNMQQYRRFRFVLEDNKIVSITEEK